MAVQYRALTRIILLSLLVILLVVAVLLRFSIVTDHFYHALVKDPPRNAPAGDVIVAPADGTIIYIRHIRDGIIPRVVKRGVSVPLVDHLKMAPSAHFSDGYLVGIYMNTQGVHINRVPDTGIIEERFIYNGPHMDMTKAETSIILQQLVPGWTTVRKILGLDPFAIEDSADYILKSARETIAMRNQLGRIFYIVRIADFYVGKIITWVGVGEEVKRGQKLGMIAWGSQTDLFFEDTPELSLQVSVGNYVYGGETIIARY